MADIKLGNDHDIVFDGNDFSVTKTKDETLQQRLKVKLLTFLEEWYLDRGLGVPWFQRIFQKGTSKETVDIILKRKIAEEPEVISIQEFSSTLDNRNRTYRLSFVVKSESSKESIPIEFDL